MLAWQVEGRVGNCLLSWYNPKQNIATFTGQDAESFLLLAGRHPRQKEDKLDKCVCILASLKPCLCYYASFLVIADLRKE